MLCIIVAIYFTLIYTCHLHYTQSEYYITDINGSHFINTWNICFHFDLNVKIQNADKTDMKTFSNY